MLFKGLLASDSVKVGLIVDSHPSHGFKLYQCFLFSKAYGRMGLANSNLGNRKEAVKCLTKAVEIDPENKIYQSNLDAAALENEVNMLFYFC